MSVSGCMLGVFVRWSMWVLTTAETEDLEVVAVFRSGQGQHRGREEHGLIVRVGDQEAYPLVV